MADLKKVMQDANAKVQELRQNTPEAKVANWMKEQADKMQSSTVQYKDSKNKVKDFGTNTVKNAGSLMLNTGAMFVDPQGFVDDLSQAGKSAIDYGKRKIEQYKQNPEDIKKDIAKIPDKAGDYIYTHGADVALIGSGVAGGAKGVTNIMNKGNIVKGGVKAPTTQVQNASKINTKTNIPSLEGKTDVINDNGTLKYKNTTDINELPKQQPISRTTDARPAQGEVKSFEQIQNESPTIRVGHGTGVKYNKPDNTHFRSGEGSAAWNEGHYGQALSEGGLDTANRYANITSNYGEMPLLKNESGYIKLDDTGLSKSVQSKIMDNGDIVSVNKTLYNQLNDIENSIKLREDAISNLKLDPYTEAKFKADINNFNIQKANIDKDLGILSDLRNNKYKFDIGESYSQVQLRDVPNYNTLINHQLPFKDQPIPVKNAIYR